jgi:hypothetical protein
MSTSSSFFIKGVFTKLKSSHQGDTSYKNSHSDSTLINAHICITKIKISKIGTTQVHERRLKGPKVVEDQFVNYTIIRM